MGEAPPKSLDWIALQLLELMVHVGFVEADLGGDASSSLPEREILLEPSTLVVRQVLDLGSETGVGCHGVVQSSHEVRIAGVPLSGARTRPGLSTASDAED